MRVGGTSIRKVDARVIAATHRNLKDMVKKGEFRKDLFFRLNVVPIHIPPLRERIEDIPPLINFFLRKFNQRDSTEKKILPQAIDCLSVNTLFQATYVNYPTSWNVLLCLSRTRISIWKISLLMFAIRIQIQTSGRKATIQIFPMQWRGQRKR